MKEMYRSYNTEDLVVMYQNTQKEDCLEEIIRRNKGLLTMWAKSYSNIPCHDMEDLLEEGYIACWQAVSNYNPAKGVVFTTLLKVYVKQRLNRLYNEATRKKRYTGADPVSWEELEEIHREGSFIDDGSSIEVNDFMRNLEGTVKSVADMLYSGMTKGEVAKSLGVTPATTNYHLKKLQRAYIAYREAV